ncbi:MAG TPA: DNA-3-methyladenine glycosylase I [Bryobacteraceae bacterium]|nr:DNA-3-methyladenine glycosylase I [Bryobacteraceae bacterium]
MIASFAADVIRLLADPGIVRSRAKIEATIGGARAYLAMQDSGEDFSNFIWEMVGRKPIQNSGEILTKTPVSEEISKALKKRGSSSSALSSFMHGCKRSDWSTTILLDASAGRRCAVLRDKVS